MSKRTSSSSGIGFFGLLTIVFIVLKLTGYIDWSWIWVLAPMWISMLIGSTILLVVSIVLIILNKDDLIELIKSKNKDKP